MSRTSARGFRAASIRSIAAAVNRVPLTIETLERRTFLSVTLIGLPDWVDLGSKPMLNASAVADPGNPASGAVEDIAIDPANPAHILVSTVNGGIWRTTNGNRPFNGVDDDGANGVDDAAEQPDWFPLTDDFPSLAMQDIEFSPLDATGNTVFAGTGSSSSLGQSGGVPIGIFRTTDGGNTWTVTQLNPGNEPQVRAILPTTFDGNAGAAGVQQVILVGANANQGLYRSTDGGLTYTPLTLAANGIPQGAVTSIIADPNNASQFFAGVVGQGVFRSTDGGANWGAVNTDLTNLAGSRVIQLTAHPGGGTTVLHALVSGPAPVAFTSDDSGADWDPLAAIPAAFTSGNNGLYTRMASDQLAVDPTNSQIVYITKGYGGSPFTYRYNPAGAGSWVQIEGAGAAGNTRPHVDTRDLEFVGTNVLISANDGGIYFMRDPQNAAANRWVSFHGRGTNGLGVTEYHNIVWDSTFNVATGGAQDNGTTVQNGAGDVIWTTYSGNDGGDVAVDTVNAGAGRVFRYSSSQNMGWLRRHTFDSATNQPVGAVDLFPMGGLANHTPFFVPSYELNTVNPARLLLGGGGTNSVYELMNAATAPNAAGATWQAVTLGAGFGAVNGSAIAYGGRSGGVDNAEVIVAGSGSRVFVRSTAGGTLAATPTAFPGGTVVDVVLDPNNWQHFFVTDGAAVFETNDAGTTWTNLTLNRPTGNTRLQSIEFVPTPDGGVVLVGGNLGVSRLQLGSAGNTWSRFGLELPNALVQDLDYNAEDDVLVAGTFGRGAWSIDDASTKVGLEGVLQIDGDNDFEGQDDIIRLIRNAANPLILEVFLNSVAPVLTVPLAAISQINVNGLAGADTLIVDSINGLISVANGIRFDGGPGSDELQLQQNGGPVRTSGTYSVGPDVGQGSNVITHTVGAQTDTQTVVFENLEPVVDLVPVANLVVNATPQHNIITYMQGSLITNGLLFIDNYESIEFSAKTVVTVNTLGGDDYVDISPGGTPAGLSRLVFNGQEGDDWFVTQANAPFSLELNGDVGNDLLDASLATAASTLRGGSGRDILIGGSESDSLDGGTGEDVLDARGGAANVVTGGADVDTIHVDGTNGADTITTTHSGATFTVTGGTSAGVSTISGIELVSVTGRSGADDITVTPSAAGGLNYSVLGGNPIGNPGDVLTLNTAASVTFNPGPENDAGALVAATTVATNVSFDEIEALSVTGGGPLVINATNGPDAITVIARDNSTHAGTDGVQDFTLAINDLPEFLFVDLASLAINALGGSDEIVLRTPAPNGADWDVAVQIHGGPPSASDRLVVETPGAAAESFVFNPNSADSGNASITEASAADATTLAFSGIEEFVYDGEGDGDDVLVNGLAGDDAFVHTPGGANDEGSVRVNSTLALHYQNLGAPAEITLDGGLGVNSLRYDGTAGNDAFVVDNSAAGGSVDLNDRILVLTNDIGNLTLEGYDGDDSFTHAPGLGGGAFAAMQFNGGAQASAIGDRVNLIGTAGDDDFVISGQSIALGGGTAFTNGIEDVRLNAAGGAGDEITYAGVGGISEDINFLATPVAGSGKLNVSGVTLVAFTNAERLEAIGNDGTFGDTDTLALTGTNAVDRFVINTEAAGTIADPVVRLNTGAGAALLQLRNYSGFNTLRMFGLDGADTFDVFTGPAAGRDVMIDGGIPSGKRKLTDVLNVFYQMPRPSIVHSAATQNPDAGLVDLDYGTSGSLIQYVEIEKVVIAKV